MKTGRTLAELATELDRQNSTKEDLIVPTQVMKMESPDSITIEGSRDYGITDHAHGQIAGRLNIPKKYYDRMKDKSPELLVDNVNYWLQNEPEQRMVRTLDGNVRAFLSDRYQRIDNFEVASMALETLSKFSQEVAFTSADVTDSRMYLNFRLPEMQKAVKVGDAVQMGMIASNSEVGDGSLSAFPMIYRLVCLNGMVSGRRDGSFLKRNHVGRRAEAGEDYSIYSDETRKADDRAIMLKIRDTINQLSDPELFQKLVAQMSAAADSSVIVNPVPAVEVLSKTLALTDSESESVLVNLLKGDIGLGTDLSKWGAANAVTRLANDVDNYDRSMQLTELGGRLLELSARDWNAIAEAA